MSVEKNRRPEFRLPEYPVRFVANNFNGPKGMLDEHLRRRELDELAACFHIKEYIEAIDQEVGTELAGLIAQAHAALAETLDPANMQTGQLSVEQQRMHILPVRIAPSYGAMMEDIREGLREKRLPNE